MQARTNRNRRNSPTRLDSGDKMDKRVSLLKEEEAI